MNTPKFQTHAGVVYKLVLGTSHGACDRCSLKADSELCEALMCGGGWLREVTYGSDEYLTARLRGEI